MMVLRAFLIMALCLLGSPLMAEDASLAEPVADVAASAEEKPVFRLKDEVEQGGGAAANADLGSMVLGLIAVLGIIFALAWLSKRFNLAVPGSSQHMKMLSAMSVGQKEKVVLVEVQGKQLLLGVTPHQVNLLHTYAAGEAEPATVNELAESRVKGEFAQRMQSLLSSGATPGATHHD